MLNHELRSDDGILVLNPNGPLEADDFTLLASSVDAYLEQHRRLRGVLSRPCKTLKRCMNKGKWSQFSPLNLAGIEIIRP